MCAQGLSNHNRNLVTSKGMYLTQGAHLCSHKPHGLLNVLSMLCDELRLCVWDAVLTVKIRVVSLHLIQVPVGLQGHSRGGFPIPPRALPTSIFLPVINQQDNL